MCRQNPLLVLILLLSCIVLGGCFQQPIDETRFFTYNQTKLGESSSGDVLNYMDMSLTTLISQSDTVVASWGCFKQGCQGCPSGLGQDLNGYQQWLNVVAFDEQSADAVRKYFFFVDEKARRIPFLHPKWAARFDGQLILDKAVLDKPYPNEEVRTIAIFKEIQKQFGADMAKVTSDNKMLGICQMVVNESFGDVARQLDESPALTSKIDTPDGWKFDSRNFFTNVVCMHEEGGIVTIKMQLGAITWCKVESEPGRPYVPPPSEKK